MDIASTVEELQRVIRSTAQSGEALTVLGGGSNVVPLRHLPGRLLLLRDDRVHVLEERVDTVLVEVGAGHDWNALVEKTLERGWSGLENLILIPGTAGAAPIQNIGAYGVELKDRLHSLLAIDRSSGELREFLEKDCEFGYRTSLFKQSGNWVIGRVRLLLSKSSQLELGYPEVARHMEGRDHTAREVARVVSAIRRQKLPNPMLTGNVGSFFKNPIVPLSQAEKLREMIPSLNTYLVDVDRAEVKLSAAQLIDRAGWKGRRERGVGVWEKQPLVLVNLGTENGSDFLAFAQKIRTDLLDRYGVSLELEPVVIGQD